MPRIRIIKKGAHVLDKYRELKEIVDDPDPNECANLIRDGLAEALTPEEDDAEQAKEDDAAEKAAKEQEKAAKAEAKKHEKE